KDATGKLVAFELKYVYVNPANTPIVTYNTPIDGYEVSFTDYTTSGSYNSTSWDFGDGVTYNSTLVPGPHTYTTTGGKIIKNKVVYGNKNCAVSFEKAINITGRLGLTGDEEQDILLFPNPANTSVTVVCKAPANNVQITILNQLGVIVKSLHFDSITDMQRIDISDLVSGYYVFSFQTVDFKATSELMVLGK
ncbi:MAG: T9SS type A sorting domain-containing protein, partial [Chitinophagales bacterium]